MIRELIEIVNSWNDPGGQAVFLIFTLLITTGAITSITAIICQTVYQITKLSYGIQP